MPKIGEYITIEYCDKYILLLNVLNRQGYNLALNL